LEEPGPVESSTRRSNPCSSPEARPPAKQKIRSVKRINWKTFRDYRSARNKTDSKLIILDTYEKFTGIDRKATREIVQSTFYIYMNGDRVA